jgi:hypothetical protein
LPELGNGEVISSDGERLVIRFSSGERNFIIDLVEKHLVATTEAPVFAKRARATRAPRATAAKKPTKAAAAAAAAAATSAS